MGPALAVLLALLAGPTSAQAASTRLPKPTERIPTVHPVLMVQPRPRRRPIAIRAAPSPIPTAAPPTYSHHS